MPELPEVEVTRRRLAPQLEGRTIERVLTTRNSYFFLTSPRILKHRLVGRRITELRRCGKYLVCGFDDQSRLLLHLGMTGQLFMSGSESPRLLSSTARSALSPQQQRGFQRDRHTHVTLEFADARPAVFFRDVRKFGKVRWLPAGGSDPRLDKLGLDALSADGPALYAACRKRSAPIKNLLLDQSVLAGVGNIYADEALFKSGIRPTRSARRLTRREADQLAAAVREVLSRSIELGGSSISDYVTPDGSDGAYQDERWVYARTALPCRRCGTAVKRRVLGQRSAHFCPLCQK